MTAKRRLFDPEDPSAAEERIDMYCGPADALLAISSGSWRDILTDRPVSGGDVAVVGLWRELPIALLVRA